STGKCARVIAVNDIQGIDIAQPQPLVVVRHGPQQSTVRQCVDAALGHPLVVVEPVDRPAAYCDPEMPRAIADNRLRVIVMGPDRWLRQHRELSLGISANPATGTSQQEASIGVTVDGGSGVGFVFDRVALAASMPPQIIRVRACSISQTELASITSS